MIFDVSKLGDILVSRPAGKDAFLMAKAYIFNNIQDTDSLVLDFGKVKVLTPSWADEFITGLKSIYNNKMQFINTQNETVSDSLKTVLEQ